MTVVKDSPDEDNSVKKVKEDVERLKEWLTKQPHLPNDMDERVLMTFVNGTNSLEIAKKKLDLWLTERGKYPQLFSFENRNPFGKKFAETYQATRLFVLPKATPEGYRVCVVDIVDITKLNLESFLMRWGLLAEVGMLLWPGLKGYYVLADFTNAQGFSLSKANPLLIAFFTNWYQRCVPFKLKHIVFVNAFPWVEISVKTIFKPLVIDKFMKKLTITKQGVSYYKELVPVDILPSDMGGLEENSDQLVEKWKRVLEDHLDFIRISESYVSDERKRPPDTENTFGVDGTFRSLNVD